VRGEDLGGGLADDLGLVEVQDPRCPRRPLHRRVVRLHAHLDPRSAGAVRLLQGHVDDEVGVQVAVGLLHVQPAVDAVLQEELAQHLDRGLDAGDGCEVPGPGRLDGAHSPGEGLVRDSFRGLEEVGQGGVGQDALGHPHLPGPPRACLLADRLKVRGCGREDDLGGGDEHSCLLYVVVLVRRPCAGTALCGRGRVGAAHALGAPVRTGGALAAYREAALCDVALSLMTLLRSENYRMRLDQDAVHMGGPTHPCR
jgi:hypothetical protein